MMSHLTHVVIVAIMAATTQVTHAAPTFDLNKIDEKFGVKEQLDLMDPQEFYNGLENVTIHFNFHKNARMVWETMQNHTTELEAVFANLTAMKEAAVVKEQRLTELIHSVNDTTVPALANQRQQAQDAINSLTAEAKDVEDQLKDQITANNQAILAVQDLIRSEVDKVNKQIEANKESSEGQDSEHTKQIEELRNILNESTDSFNKKLDDARSDLSDTIQEKTDAIRLDIDEVCDKDEEMNETVSEHTTMIAAMQDYIDALKDKVNVLEGDKTNIDHKLFNLERTVGDVTNVMNNRHICPSGYDYVKQHDRCLMFVKTELSYENAEDECQKHFSRGHLAFVESKAVSDYLLKQKATDSDDMEDSTPWIALRYDDTTKEWRWLNAGLDFGEHSWTNWAPEQPNMKKNCVKLDDNGKWMTGGCGKEEMAWCQATPAHVDTLQNQQPQIVY